MMMELCIFLSVLLMDGVFSASGAFSQSSTQGKEIVLLCKSEGSVNWDKRNDRGRIDVFFVQDEKDTLVCRRDPDRFIVLSDSSLLIKRVTESDSGIYYCNNSPVVNLSITPSQEISSISYTTTSIRRITESSTNTYTTATLKRITESLSSTYTTASFEETTGGVSEVARGLMFGGVGLAFLSFLLATVSAGRAILHQAWQAGRDSVHHESHYR